VQVDDSSLDVEIHDENALHAIESDFENVLADLRSNPQLERFHLEYETIYRAMRKSHESEKRLVKKGRELISDIAATSTKVALAAKLTIDDQSTIEQLKNGILRTSAAIESSLLKEKDTKEELAILQDDIAQLRQEVRAGAGSSLAQENNLRDLIMLRDDLARDRDSIAHHVMQLRADVADLTERLKSVQAEKDQTDGEVENLAKDLAVIRSQTEAQKERKEKEEARLKELKSCLEQRQLALKETQLQISKGSEQTARLELELREQKQSADRALKEVDAVNNKMTKLSDELNEQVARNVQLVCDNTKRAMELAAKQDEVHKPSILNSYNFAYPL